jgi:hypothetical protein
MRSILPETIGSMAYYFYESQCNREKTAKTYIESIESQEQFKTLKYRYQILEKRLNNRVSINALE